MKLDIGSIWNEASELVRSNHQVLAAVAGVFFLLPSFAFALLMPAPKPQPDAAPEAMLGMLREFYIAAAPWLIAMIMVQALGQMATFALLARSGRMTVAEALREALTALFPYLGTQLILTLGFALIAAVGAGIAAAIGSIPLMVLLGLVGFVAAIYVSLRLTMVLPVIAVDRVRNPVSALQRSWNLTRGNVGPILLYMVLLVVVFVVASIVVGIVVGLLAALLGGARSAEVVGAAISGLLSAGFTVYIVASMAAMHRRLTGGTGEDHAVTFG
jgi:hypothetical protein